MPFYKGTNKITLEGYNHLTWRYKVIPYIRTDNCTDMSNMFSGANYSLPETLDLRNFNTSHVTTMESMFEDCVSENILGLDIFNTSNVEDMSSMFKNSNAAELDLTSFDTSNVETMEDMFCGSAVEDLDISSFDTSSVENMSGMFEDVAASIDVSNFDTSSVINMHNMLKGTSGTTLDLTHFDTSHVTDMSGMFMNTDYEDIDYSTFDTSAVINMASMFNGSKIETIDVSTFDMSDVTNIAGMFANISPQTFVFPNTLDLSSVEDIRNLFSGAEISTVDLRGISFPLATSEANMFSGLKTNLLDISDWDLGDNAGTEGYENLFQNAEIHEIRFSNSNTFPQGYKIPYMFGYFKTDGTLDLSSFVFDQAYIYSSSAMLNEAKINTLILPDLDNNSFDKALQTKVIFNNTGVELLDGSNTTLNLDYCNRLFAGLTATRVNMPNKICTEHDEASIYSYAGRAKYLDYSALDTRNADYTAEQWNWMASYCLYDSKIVWIPSTFVLDGNVTMENLSGDIYTDALSYEDLGWILEPTNAVMHYGATHADFEQAILNDNPDEWTTPNSSSIFFCHSHVPLGSSLSLLQFDPRYSSDYYYKKYLDGEPVEDGYVFDTVGTHTLTLVAGNYEYKQTLTVVDHGNTYSIVGSPRDYTWDSTNKRYVNSVSTKIECRLYPDNYLFIYPIGTMVNSISAYTAVESTPSSNVVKVSGIPFNVNRFCLTNSTRLTDISELIPVTYGEHGFNSYDMFRGCSSLVDVSVIGKWNITRRYGYYYVSSGRTYTRYEYYTNSSMLQGTAITSAPRMSLCGTSIFTNCTMLTDISKMKAIESEGLVSGNIVNIGSMFSGCTRLSNVSRLKEIFKRFQISYTNSSYHLGLYDFLHGTAITNTDFIPDGGVRVSTLNGAFNGCSSLTDLTGIGRIIWSGVGTTPSFDQAFYGIPATDYSPLEDWNGVFSVINMGNTRITDLSFLSTWDLSRCVSYNFASCTRLTSISILTGRISTTREISVNLNTCTALTSLVGLEGCTFSANSATTFQNCSALTSANGLQGCTFSYASSLFYRCTSLADVSALAEATFTSSVTNINGMFSDCSALTSTVGLQTIDVSNMTQLNSVFSGCSSLTNLSGIAAWNPYQVKSVNYLFYNCSSITSFAALQNWITGQLTSATQTFRGCSSLINLEGLIGFNVGQCTTLSYLFADCTALTDITDITLWYIGICTNLSYMFYNCSSLASIAPLRGWYVAKLTNMTYMFYGCVSIADADALEQWKNVKTMTSVSRNYAFRNVPTPWPTWAIS